MLREGRRATQQLARARVTHTHTHTHRASDFAYSAAELIGDVDAVADRVEHLRRRRRRRRTSKHRHVDVVAGEIVDDDLATGATVKRPTQN